MDERWLKCEVGKGMFSDEAWVRVVTADGGTWSFFVPAAKVDPGEGRLRVQVFRRGKVPWAVIPNEYREAVSIRDEDLQPA